MVFSFRGRKDIPLAPLAGLRSREAKGLGVRGGREVSEVEGVVFWKRAAFCERGSACCDRPLTWASPPNSWGRGNVLWKLGMQRQTRCERPRNSHRTDALHHFFKPHLTESTTFPQHRERMLRRGETIPAAPVEPTRRINGGRALSFSGREVPWRGVSWSWRWACWLVSPPFSGWLWPAQGARSPPA